MFRFQSMTQEFEEGIVLEVFLQLATNAVKYHHDVVATAGVATYTLSAGFSHQHTVLALDDLFNGTLHLT